MKARFAAVLAIATIVAVNVPRASAVFEVGLKVTEMYATSKDVSAGKIVKIDAEHQLLEVDITQTYKGDAAANHVRIRFQQADLLKDAAEGQPVMVFVATKRPDTATLRVSDRWLIATLVPKSTPAMWLVKQEKQDFYRTFPGRTVALQELIAQIKDGKHPLLDKTENKVFTGGIKEIAKLKVSKPAALIASDLSADKKATLLVPAADATHAFASADKTFAPIGEPLPGGLHAAVGDLNGDGKRAVLVGKTLYTIDAGKFTPLPAKLDLPPDADLLAIALADVTGDKKADVIALKKTGELLVFENPGAPDKPWTARPARQLWQDEKTPPSAAAFGDFGDDGQLHVIVLRDTGITRYAVAGDDPPADFTKLTGEKLEVYNKDKPNWLASGKLVPLDMNGDGRPDLLIVSPTAGLLLVNRGFGAYLVNPDADKDLKGGPFPITPGTQLVGADIGGDKADDLLILTEDGTLFQAANPPAAKP